MGADSSAGGSNEGASGEASGSGAMPESGTPARADAGGDVVDLSVDERWLDNVEKVSLKESIPEGFLDDPQFPLTFNMRASLEIARWVLGIFSGVYVLCFIYAFVLMTAEDATYEGGVEILKLMLTTALPLVTLAVGYYLGDRSSSSG